VQSGAISKAKTPLRGKSPPSPPSNISITRRGMLRWIVDSDRAHQIGPESISNTTLYCSGGGAINRGKHCRVNVQGKLSFSPPHISTTRRAMLIWVADPNRAHQIGLESISHTTLYSAGGTINKGKTLSGQR